MLRTGTSYRRHQSFRCSFCHFIAHRRFLLSACWAFHVVRLTRRHRGITRLVAGVHVTIAAAATEITGEQHFRPHSQARTTFWMAGIYRHLVSLTSGVVTGHNVVSRRCQSVQCAGGEVFSDRSTAEIILVDQRVSYRRLLIGHAETKVATTNSADRVTARCQHRHLIVPMSGTRIVIALAGSAHRRDSMSTGSNRKAGVRSGRCRAHQAR
jgi:hypothetical protein